MIRSLTSASHVIVRAESESGQPRTRVVVQRRTVRRPVRLDRGRVNEETESSTVPSQLVSSIVDATSTLVENEERSEVPHEEMTHESLERKLEENIRLRNWAAAIKTAHALISMDAMIPSTALDSLFQGACAKGYFRKVISLYSRLGDQRSLLSYQSYHFLLQFALKNRLFERALKLYNDMRESGYSLNRLTYTMIVTGLLRDKRKGSRSRTAAYSIWCEIKKEDKYFDAALFRAGCAACVAVGRMKEAEELIPNMKQKGYRPENRFYNILINRYCQLGNMKSALAWFEKMKADKIEPLGDTYNTLIQGFVRNNQIEKAEGMLKYTASEARQPDVWAYTSLMKGYVKKGRLHDVERVFNEFISRGGKPTEVTYGVLIDGYVTNGRMDLALRQLPRMTNDGLEPNLIIYNTLLKGYASDGLNSKAKILRLLDEMKQRGIYPAVDTLNTILTMIAESESSGAAVGAFLDAMIKLGFLPDAVSYTLLLRAAHKDRDTERCIQIFETMKTSPAIELDMVCWNFMVSILCQSKRMEQADETLREAVKFAQARSLPIPVEAFGAIIHGHIQMNNLPVAIAKFRWFCKLGGQPDDAMFRLLLETCIRKQDFHHALKIMRATKLLHSSVDLSKYRAILEQSEELHRHWNEASGEKKDVAFERLKFWLGMPNSYYSSEWP